MKKVIIKLIISILSIILVCYLAIQWVLYAPQSFNKYSWQHWLIPSLYVLESTPIYNATTQPVYSYNPQDGEATEYVTMRYVSNMHKTQLIKLYRDYFIHIGCIVKPIRDRFNLDRVLAGQCIEDTKGFIELSLEKNTNRTITIFIVFTNHTK